MGLSQRIERSTKARVDTLSITYPDVGISGARSRELGSVVRQLLRFGETLPPIRIVLVAARITRKILSEYFTPRTDQFDFNSHKSIKIKEKVAPGMSLATKFNNSVDIKRPPLK